MSEQESSAYKRVSVEEIRPGVCVVGLDRSWSQTQVIFSHKVIQSAEEIEQLKKNGIREVVIDTTRGADVETGRAIADHGQVIAQGEEAGSASLAKSEPSLSAETELRPPARELAA